MTRQHPLVAVLAALGLLFAPPGAVAQSYAVTDLGPVAAGDPTGAFGLNAAGQVAGLSGGRAALWGRGAVTSLALPPGGLDSDASTLNDSGEVSGSSSFQTYASVHACFWQNGQVQDCGTLGGPMSQARAVNSLGQIAGEADRADGSHHAFVWRNGTMTDLGVPAGFTDSAAYGLNDAGQAAGFATSADGLDRAVLFSGGAVTDLGTLPGGDQSRGFALNAGGQVVGEATVAGGAWHAFLSNGGRMTDLGTLPGDTDSTAVAINSVGRIVGESRCSANGFTEQTACIWTGGSVADLGGLLPAASGWTLQQANAINGRGQIAGVGVNAQAQRHAFLLTPLRFDMARAGHDALLWQNVSDGRLCRWQMDDQRVLEYGGFFAQVSNTDWKVVGMADMDGDGHPDLLWWNRRTGELVRWLMDDQRVLGYGGVFNRVSDTNWRPISLADMDGDGKPDILWQNVSDGRLCRWLMADQRVLEYGGFFAQVSNTDWRVVGTGDFDGDGHTDLLWQNQADGRLIRWLMNDQRVLEYGTPFAQVSDTRWKVAGTGDSNGDGRPDILWQNQSDGRLCRWLMDDQTVLEYGGFFMQVGDIGWKIVGVH